MLRLEQQSWPGNVRELGNFIRRAVALSRGGEIGVEALEHGKKLAGKEFPVEDPRHHTTGLPAEKLAMEDSPTRGLAELKPGLSLEEMERQLFAMTLESTGGNRARAAELLGVSLRTVRNKVREFGLPPHHQYGKEDYRKDDYGKELRNRNVLPKQ
jgi:DNA-binding NtrC family response regulator